MRSEYNAGLKQRGSITFWLSSDVIEKWLLQEKTGRRGASHKYSKDKPRQAFHLITMPKYNSMVIVKLRLCQEMKIYGLFVRWDARNGKENVVIISVQQ